jgi:hypothetical protein
MGVEAHAYKTNTHKSANKMYRFSKFITPPNRPIFFIIPNGSGAKHFGIMIDIFLFAKALW